MKKLLLLFAVLLTAGTASAYDFVVDGIYYNVISLKELTCEVTNSPEYTYTDDIVIPSSVTYNGRTFSVTKIGENAFMYGSKITSVVIPNSVTEIGSSAFYYCNSMTSVVIPSSVTSMGNSAFDGCSSLASVVIPNSVKEIGETSFLGCTGLKEIFSMPETPPSICPYSFEGVSKAEVTVIVPDESVDAYMNAEYWQMFWNIIGLKVFKKCKAPEITLVDGKIIATSATEGATCCTSITSDDFKCVDGSAPIELCGIYTISSYAHAEGCENSDTVSATLVWVNPTLDGSEVISMEAKKAVLIRSNGNEIVVSGTERGEMIQILSLDGRILRSTRTEDEETSVPVPHGSDGVIIVKYSGKAVKMAVK